MRIRIRITVATTLITSDPRQPIRLLKKKNMACGYPARAGDSSGSAYGTSEAGDRREGGPRVRVGQLAYVSNSAILGVPEALVISKVIFFREVAAKPMTPLPLPEARTAPVSWLTTR